MWWSMYFVGTSFTHKFWYYRVTVTIVVLPSAPARALSSNAGVIFGLCSGWQLKSYGCQNLYANVARAIASGPYFSYLGGTQFLDLLGKAYFINCFLTLSLFFHIYDENTPVTRNKYKCGNFAVDYKINISDLFIKTLFIFMYIHDV